MRGVQGRRVRHHPGVRRVAVRARPRGRQVARRPHREEDVRARDGPGPAGVPAQPAPADLPGPARARGARLHLRLREDQPLQACTCARTACSPTPTSPPRGCRRRASSRCWSRSAPSCRRRCSARRTRRRAPTPSPNALRENLKKARALLEQAGWNIDADGVLRNAKGEPFEFEYLRRRASSQFATSIWQRNLEKLGITLKVRRSTSRSTASGSRRSTSTSITIRTPDFTLPSRGRLRRAVRQQDGATRRAPSNYRGVKDPAVDAHARRRWSEAKTYERAARRGARARPRRDAEPLPGAGAVLARTTSCRTGTSSACPTRSPSTTRSTSRAGLGRPVVRHDLVDQGRRARVASRILTELSAPMLSYIAQAPAADDPDAARRADGHLHRHPVRARAARSSSCVAEMRARAAARARRLPARRRDLDAKQIEELKKLYGFDKPPLVRYFEMLGELRALRPRHAASCTTRTCGS